MEYIEVPEIITEKTIIDKFGTDAFRFYNRRISERKMQGKIYYDPLKTIYIWAAKDKKTNQGFYSTWRGAYKGRKAKNHGAS